MVKTRKDTRTILQNLDPTPIPKYTFQATSFASPLRATEQN